MAVKRKETIECPYCDHKQEFESYENIELSQDKDIRTKILNEELFSFTCEDCGKKAIIAFPCLFSDMDKKMLIWLIGDYTEDQKAALDDDLASSALSDAEKKFADDYQKRIVGSINELKEKILIAEDDLDDRVVEVLKMLCINEVIDQLMHLTLQEVRYNKTEAGQKFLVLVFAEKEPSMIEITMDMYNTVKDMFMDDIIEATPKEGFAEINAFWAKALIEANAEKSEEAEKLN